MSDDNRRRKASRQSGLGIAIGIAIGAALGAALGNIAMGVGLGVAIGVALGLAMDRSRKLALPSVTPAKRLPPISRGSPCPPQFRLRPNSPNSAASSKRIEHAQSMLGVDEAVMMPTGGGEKRAESMSMLAGMYHEMATAPEIADWLADAQRGAARRHAAGRDPRAAAHLHQHDLPHRPISSASRSIARMRSEQLWRELRAKDDWAGFLPAFEGVVAIAREEAELRAKALGLDPYDAMMEQFDPGNRAADITPVFDRLKTFLKDFIPEALDASGRRSAPRAAR